MNLRAAAVVIACLSSPMAANAQASDTPSADEMIAACRSAVATPPPPETFPQGLCIGYVAAVMDASDLLPPQMRFCAPLGVTRRQATGVVLAYIDARGPGPHHSFKVLLFEALRKAWPCG